jgi:chromosome segregation ATPase
MLDAFKGRSSDSKREVIGDERHELERLIQTARAERNAMDETLLTLRARSASLKPIGKLLEHIDQKVTDVTTKLEEIGDRLGALDGRTRNLEGLDERVQSLKEEARLAEQTVQSATGPDSQLAKHRDALEQLAAHTEQTTATLSGLKMEHAALEELRNELRATQQEVKQSVEQATVLGRELDAMRGTTAGLTDQCARLAETSRVAREDTAVAITAIQDVEKKLGPLAQLQELGQNTEERLVTLNALAERVSLKAKVIEGQQATVEHALVQANRVNEMVWSMEVQIGKLNEGMKQAAAADETLDRLEKLSGDITERLQATAKLYEDTENQALNLEKRGASLLESMQAQVGMLEVDKTEVDAVGERLRALLTAIGRAETRINGLAGHEKALSTVSNGVEALSKRFDDLFAQSEELTTRQISLEGVHDRLAQVDDLARRASSQMDWLKQGRQDLDALRKDVLEFHTAHAEISRLGVQMATDRQAIHEIGERMAAISTRAPELEAKVEAVVDMMSIVENASHKASGLQELMTALDGQVARLEARAALVEGLETRLNGLNTLSADIDRRLAQQFERRADFDIMKTASDGVVAQIADAHHRIDALNAVQARFTPLVDQVRALETEIAATRAQLAEIRPDDAVVAEHERRFADLMATSRALATELAGRKNSMQALADELERSEKVKAMLMTELERVQARQRETADHIAASEDQLARAERMFKQVEDRRVQIALAENKLTAAEARLADIKALSDDLERSHDAIEAREELVNAVKAQVEAIHTISARSKADLDHVMQQRGEVAALRQQVDQLSSRMAETGQRVAAIDARRQALDEVESKANVILELLDDVRINVETIGEQKTIVDQVAQTAAQLEFKLQEARSIVGKLQHEREQAERLEQGARQASMKAAKPEDELIRRG